MVWNDRDGGVVFVERVEGKSSEGAGLDAEGRRLAEFLGRSKSTE
jgi:hypothetical protein